MAKSVFSCKLQCIFDGNTLNMSLIFCCLNLSSRSVSREWSQSGWRTRGTGLGTFCMAAGMVMIFWMAELNRSI
jgi:hypothetical protein